MTERDWVAEARTERERIEAEFGRDLEQAQKVIAAAEKVVEMAFATQLNNRAALLPLMQDLEQALFRYRHPEPGH